MHRTLAGIVVSCDVNCWVPQGRPEAFVVHGGHVDAFSVGLHGETMERANLQCQSFGLAMFVEILDQKVGKHRSV